MLAMAFGAVAVKAAIRATVLDFILVEIPRTRKIILLS
jgi:hypothetical protein